MKIIALSVFCVVSISVFSQKSVSRDLKKTSIDQQENSETKKSQGVYYSDYVIHPEKLKTYFISGEIPVEFPRYDKLKTFDENKITARNWAKANKELVKSEYWHLFENK
jgi:hypothetical protein